MTTTVAADAPQAVPTQLDIFVLAGQSNMSGRGDLAASPLPHPDVWMWRDARWSPAVEPLCGDLPKAAGGLAATFARRHVRERGDGTKIGFVGCAVGGSPLSAWEEGGDLHVAAAEAVRAAVAAAAPGPAATARVAGVLWHQGETDSGDAALTETYQARLLAAVAALRASFGALEAPFVLGELGRFCSGGPRTPFAEQVTAATHAVAAEAARAAVVGTEGLADKGDLLHFDTAAVHTLGERYYEAFVKASR